MRRHTQVMEGFGRTFGTELLATGDLGLVRVVGFPMREGDPDHVLEALDSYLVQDDRPVIAFNHNRAGRRHPADQRRQPELHLGPDHERTGKLTW